MQRLLCSLDIHGFTYHAIGSGIRCVVLEVTAHVSSHGWDGALSTRGFLWIYVRQLTCLQYVDKFFARMEHLKRVSSWRKVKIEKELLREVERGLRKRFDIAAAERSLREALSAQKLDTQLSQGSLQKLEVCVACRWLPPTGA